MRGRRRPARERAEAVGIAVFEGVTAAERETGIPKQTIHEWLQSDEFGHLRTRARDVVAAEWWAGVQVGFAAVLEGLRDPDQPLRDKAQALAVLYDRLALMTGGATSRMESRDITGTLSDADLIDAIREAQRLIGDGRAAPAPAGEATS